MKAHVRDFECPTCGAPVGRGCRTRTSYMAFTHSRRWKLAGRSPRDPADLDSEYEHGRWLDLAAKIALLPANRFAKK